MDCMCEGGHVGGIACKYWHGSSEGPADLMFAMIPSSNRSKCPNVCNDQHTSVRFC